MNDLLTRRRLAALLCAWLLTACSDKHDVPAPAAPPPATAPAVAPSAAAPAPAPAAAAASAPIEHAQHAELVCDDRKIVLDATCSNMYGPELMACTRQSLTFLDSAAGREAGKRDFAAAKGEGDDPPVIEEKVGALTCTRTASGERYVVADMFNGGNCEQCEWHDVYDWQGKLVGSDRDRAKTDKRVADIVSAAAVAGQAFGHGELKDFYAEGKQ
ncbi:hypothetical protein [Massilia sp. CT11-137]|uniref:hypothetical protein n=1 Tax=Massilia sp. CT11-137 TaxID=3393901 RepID=UPI0039A6B149